MFPPLNISSAVEAQRGYLALDLHMRGMSPSRRLLCNLVEEARRTPDGLCGGSRGSVVYIIRV